LHFGAVDQWCEVYINNRIAGSHEGGYLPFAFDITGLIKPGENTVVVGVTDAWNAGCHAYGKQSEHPGGIWHTGQCGIWQTVWLESVPKRHVKKLFLTPDLDGSRLLIEAPGCGGAWFAVLAEGRRVFVGELDSKGKAAAPLPGFIPWTPENPFLYDLLIKLGDDVVKSYFAMRKVSVLDGKIALNGRPLFLTGLLDQGYWSDGLYTAPSDEAMIYDIKTAKSLGFNLLRKHVKIEPLRWYYHCDRLGMLVMQDFPNGGEPYERLWTRLIPIFLGIQADDRKYCRFGRKYESGRRQFEQDMEETVRLLYNSPSVVCWALFNEGWGQFDSASLSKRLRELDPTRLIDAASGWHDRGCGDFKSRHAYRKKARLKGDGRILALTQFGGYMLDIGGGSSPRSALGFKRFKTCEEYNAALERLYRKQVLPWKKRGLALCVYAQLSDVEDELNGLLTFNRRIQKADSELLLNINNELKEG
jgi:hypothetical protein